MILVEYQFIIDIQRKKVILKEYPSYPLRLSGMQVSLVGILLFWAICNYRGVGASNNNRGPQISI